MAESAASQGPSTERRVLIEREIERLRKEQDVLVSQWNKKERLAVFGLLAVPAFFLGDLRWALLFVVATPFLVLTQAYLLWIRQRECRDLIRQLSRDLAREKPTAQH